MFVVGPVSRTHDPEKDSWTLFWPVVFEDTDRGYPTEPVITRPSRDEAQAVADALNKTLADAG